ncbi:MAG: hypothetical protein M0042_00465 [Nitrospiraceae bacterium]|nr:hypothetical protein [Nitrospiraceae bacterium]
MRTKSNIWITVSLLFIATGCVTFPTTQPDNKLLFSWEISKSNISHLKSTIVNEGYERTSKDNFLHEGALITFYIKEVRAIDGKEEVRITLGFKESEPPNDLYRNLTLGVFSEHKHGSAVTGEINRMEGILYKQLVDLSGAENVIRGKKEIDKRLYH